MPLTPDHRTSRVLRRADALGMFVKLNPLCYMLTDLPYAGKARCVSSQRTYLVAATQAHDLRLDVPLFPLVCAAIEDFTMQIATNSVTGDQTAAFEQFRSAAISMSQDCAAAFSTGPGVLALQPILRVGRRWAALNNAASFFCQETKAAGGIVVVVPSADREALRSLPRFVHARDTIKIESCRGFDDAL